MNILNKSGLLLFFPAFLVLWIGLFPYTVNAGKESELRPATLAGTWYPADADKLEKSIRQFLEKAPAARVPGRVVAVAVPHAGHVYSGQVAANVFKLIEALDFETVVMIGPSHRTRFSGISINMQDYETPLGIVPLDRELAQILIDRGAPLVKNHPSAHNQEHCLEIQLPFLQVIKKDIRIVPCLMGQQDILTCSMFADVLTEAIRDRKVLLLVSTDLSHFHDGEEARRLDNRLIDLVRSFSPQKLHQELGRGEVEACGGGALVTTMMAARNLGADKATILKYAHSGDVTGDNSRVVGYFAAAFTGTGAHKAPPDAKETELDEKDRNRLLSLARKAIVAAMDGEMLDPLQDISEPLQAPRGAFVTLKKNGQLRGCIGRIQTDEPLVETIPQMARAAAFKDPRFPPLEKDELADLHVEISVLTPIKKVADVEDIQIGRDGLIIIKDYHQGLLLPQVPVEQGWNRLEFLDNTCRKAGLPKGCWKDGATLLSFSALVFGEEK